MICALLIGREGSYGFPGKNLLNVLGRPLCAYPMIAATESNFVEKLYVSTDSESIKEVALSYNAKLIDRPAELANKTALGEDAYKHGFDVISNYLAEEGHELEFLILLMCNAPTVSAKLIDEGVDMLRKISKQIRQYQFRYIICGAHQGHASKIKTVFFNHSSPLKLLKKKKLLVIAILKAKYFLQIWGFQSFALDALLI